MITVKIINVGSLDSISTGLFNYAFALDQFTLLSNVPTYMDDELRLQLCTGVYVEGMFSIDWQLHFIQEGSLYKIGPHTRYTFNSNDEFMKAWTTFIENSKNEGVPIDYLQFWNMMSL